MVLANTSAGWLQSWPTVRSTSVESMSSPKHPGRKTKGSWKGAKGEDIAYVSAQMGHAKTSITADIYTHLLDKHRPQAAKRTDELLFGKAAAAE